VDEQLPDIQTLDAITLPDGVTLNPQQTAAAILHATTDLTHEEIAERAGYQTRQGVSTFLLSKNGRLAVRAALIQHLQDAGRTGLRATINLANSARSETVRQLAAAKLVEWSGIAAEAQPEIKREVSNREISINISLGTATSGTLSVEPALEGEAQEIRPDQQRIQDEE